MAFRLVNLLIILVICGQFRGTVNAKHHLHRFRCPFLKHCSPHKHKVCGSDGKLYDSHCHLRKASCEQGTQLKVVRRHQCDLANGAFDYEQHGGNGLIADHSEAAALNEDQQQNRHQVDVEQQHPSQQNFQLQSEPEVQPSNFNETSNGQSLISKNDGGQLQKSGIEECRTEQYELMKYQLLQKVMNNDLALLFAQLDENKDNQININELWKKSSVFKPAGSSPCLITDLLQLEDRNQNDLLDFVEFQNAFRKFLRDTSGTVLDVNMVSLDESLSVNTIHTHLGDNIEIRCDIVGKPVQPKVKWYRNNVDLATLNIANIKVFNDGLLYLSDVILAFTGNYTCQAENNSIIKQTHVLKVIMTPLVKVSPHFHWANIGSSFSISCEYQCLFDTVHIQWFKNDEPIVNNQRITMLNNNTKLELSELSRSDTGAYTCRTYNHDAVYSQDTASLVVQDEPVSEQSAESYKSRLWIFHKNGVSIHSIGCSGLLHEMDARDFIPINGLTLCGGLAETSTGDQQSKSTEDGTCTWSENAILLNEKIYIGQPNLNRVIVFDTQHLSVSQILATDPRPMKLFLVPGVREQRIWLLCYGNDLEHRLADADERKAVAKDELNEEEDGLFGKFDSNLHIHQHNPDQYFESADEEKKSDQFEWKSFSREQQLHNRKTIQILRLASSSAHSIVQNVVHLQPIDGHFDLVYNLFVPKSLDEYHLNNGGNLASSIGNLKNGQEPGTGQRWAYASHYEERSLIKIDMESFKYIKSISLADCHPIDAVFTQFGLLIVQCETPVTYQLNGQLVLDQITDSIIDYNTEIKAHKSYLSPNEQFLISIFHNSSEFGAISSTIIVQKATQSGLEFLYDVKTTLIIVDCDFVWKNGNFDALLASASPASEDAIYLTLVDGKVELISAVGKPGKNLKRKIAIKSSNKLAAITSAQSVFVVNLKNNRVQCETDQQHLEPKVLVWT